MKRLFRNIHLWLSIPFGIIITLICFSGASLVFETEITEALHPHRYFVEQVGEKPLPLASLGEKVQASLPDSVQVTGVTIPADPKRTYQFNLSKPRRASLYVNPYTGEQTGPGKRDAYFDVMFRMHRWLLGSNGSAGKRIVGISVIALVLIVISGIVIAWPHSPKGWKNRFSFHVSKGWFRFLYDLHVSGGMYAAVFLLAMALTGLNWSFPWYRTTFYKLFGVEAQARGGREGDRQPDGGRGLPKGKEASYRKEHKERGRIAPEESTQSDHNAYERRLDAQSRSDKGDGRAHQNGETNWKRPGGKRPSGTQSEAGAPQKSEAPTSFFAHWDDVYKQLARKNPDARAISLSEGKTSVSTPWESNRRQADTYRFEPETGKITSYEPAAQANPSNKLFGWIYAVHVGSWGGLATRILAFLAALTGATLPLTGYYLWIRRITRRRKGVEA